MAVDSWAQVKDGRVVNTVAWDGDNATPDEQEAIFPGSLMIKILPNIACSAGDYYNPADGLFYQDANFTLLSGAPIPPTASEAYELALSNLAGQVRGALLSVKAPYSEEEAQTWWLQYHEAEEWTADNDYVPVMLNAMVAASYGGWQLSTLASNILTNAAAWKAGVGSIIGQQKDKYSRLMALKAEVDAGTKTVNDMVNFDWSITVPTVSIVDKFN